MVVRHLVLREAPTRALRIERGGSVVGAASFVSVNAQIFRRFFARVHHAQKIEMSQAPNLGASERYALVKTESEHSNPIPPNQILTPGVKMNHLGSVFITELWHFARRQLRTVDAAGDRVVLTQ